MAMKLENAMVLKGVICCESGLHIGTGKDEIEIGGIDNPVIELLTEALLATAFPSTAAPVVVVVNISVISKAGTVFHVPVERLVASKLYEKATTSLKVLF